MPEVISNVLHGSHHRHEPVPAGYYVADTGSLVFDDVGKSCHLVDLAFHLQDSMLSCPWRHLFPHQ